MYKNIKIIGVVILFLLLVLVRAFSSKLCYDPFIEYFKNDYLYLPFPKYDTFKLMISIFIRYVLNASISLGIIYLLFKKTHLKFSIKFYVLAFVILLMIYFIAIQFSNSNYLFFFYIRRFLIQPIFILILLPAFYYIKK